MRSLVTMFVTAATMLASPAFAQNNNLEGEVIVTGQRASSNYYRDEQTVIGLRRQADSAIQRVQVNSDSRDEQTRKTEIWAMIESAMRRASAAGVELVTGELELVPITQANYRDIIIQRGGRPDTSFVSLYVKTKLAGSTGTAQNRIDSFIKSVPASGRSLMEKQGSLTLTIINPDQYRDEIVKLVAAESLKYAGYFGANYAVEVSGLDQELSWSQVSGSDVFLYIPYRFTITPR